MSKQEILIVEKLKIKSLILWKAGKRLSKSEN